ncbi:MAG: beta-aspartyl-peptidase [Bacteroidetes bacterium]|nr:beta-aspartyl-peptidase [Bacteroidota bacterium]
MKSVAVALHGGAGTLRRGFLPKAEEEKYILTLSEARDTAFYIVESGGSALDAVIECVKILEDSPLFNAGKGSVFTANGTHEMDASIMEGKSRNAGAVSMVTGIRNPVQLARDVMEKSGHVILAGEGAMEFARSQGYEFLPPSYFYNELRYNQWQKARESDVVQLDHSINPEGKFGTVGAVALDLNGNLAAATSTGGMTNKKFGRIGDSPIIGAGTYANNNTCAVSCTGSGEYFIRGVVAYDVSAAMEFGGLSLAEASELVINKRLIKIEGDGGLVAVDANGNVSLPFNTEGMYRAYRTSSESKVAIYEDWI